MEITFCPYCRMEIGGFIRQHWTGDYLPDFDLECPECGNKMEIDVESVPVFYAHKKDNLLGPDLD